VNKILSQKGDTILEIVIAALVTSISMAIVLNVVQIVSGYQTTSKHKLSLVTLRNNLEALLKREDLFALDYANLNNSAFFSCMSGGPPFTSCFSPPAGGWTAGFEVYSNTALADYFNSTSVAPGDPTQGFTDSLQICTGAPSVSCPIQPVFSWVPLFFNSGSSGLIYLTVSFNLPPGQTGINLSSLSFTLVRHVPGF
jgi:hypothetical protein